MERIEYKDFKPAKLTSFYQLKQVGAEQEKPKTVTT